MSFGVTALMSASGKVYYSHELRHRDIGRVSDLLSARLGALIPSLDPSLRALLLYGSSQSLWSAREQPDADRAVTLEVGVEDHRVWVVTRFPVSSEWIRGLSERIAAWKSQKPVGEDRFLVSLSSYASEIIFRTSESQLVAEVVAVFNPHRVMEGQLEPTAKIEWQALTESQSTLRKPHPHDPQWIELGDVNYAELLKRAPIGKELQPASTGTLIAHGSQPTEEAATVPSGVSEAESAVHVRGKPTADSEDAFLVKGERATKKRRSSRIKESEPTGAFAKIRRWISRSLGEEEDEETFVESPQPSEAEPVMAPFEAPSHAEPDVSLQGTGTQGLSEEAIALQDLLGSWEQEIDPKFAEIRKTLVQHGAKPTVVEKADHLFQTYTQERARVAELAESLTRSARQKDLDHQARERSYQNEIKKMEEQLRQKSAQLERNRDQLAQLNMNLERAKGSGSSGEEQMLRHKLMQANKVAQVAREESQAHQRKVEELKNQLVVAQARARTSSDTIALQGKLDRAVKQAEEYRRVNAQLVERLNQPTDNRGAEVHELQKKLDYANRLLTGARKEAEKLALKVEELHREKEQSASGEPHVKPPTKKSA